MAKKNMTKEQLDNLKPIKDGNDPRIKNAHSPEAIAKQVESHKKTNLEKKRRNKMADDLLYILSLPEKEASKYVADIDNIKSFEDLGKSDNCTIQDEILKALVIEAKNGNTKAFEIIRDTIGEKPVDIKVNILEDAAEISMQVADALFGDNEDDTEGKEDE